MNFTYFFINLQNGLLMKKTFFYILIFVVGLTSCEQLGINADDVNLGNTDSLTNDEVIEGLKTALAVGTDSSTSFLSAVNGYYGTRFKIPLPEEAENIRTQINQLRDAASGNFLYQGVATTINSLGIDSKLDSIVLSINRAAEDAAKEASPIFKGAITDLSISDGWDILNGKNPAETMKADEFDSTAATNYFKYTTTTALTNLYAPKIDASLDKKLIGNFSTNELWKQLVTLVNGTLDKPLVSTAISSLGVTVNRIQNESIGEYATEKALNGLFIKVGEEEKQIRNNPLEWAIDILEKVFGYVKDQFSK